MKVVLTGGPCGGKTTMTQAIKKEFGDSVVIVPEAASLLFTGGFPRARNPQEMIYQQRAIYFLQREMEDLLSVSNPNKTILCDRGTLDGQAYWPVEAPVSFLPSVGTTLQKELERYDAILHLETTQGNYDTTNPLRIETHSQALEIDKKLQVAWSLHPNWQLIRNSRHFFKKFESVLQIFEKLGAKK